MPGISRKNEPSTTALAAMATPRLGAEANEQPQRHHTPRGQEPHHEAGAACHQPGHDAEPDHQPDQLGAALDARMQPGPLVEVEHLLVVEAPEGDRPTTATARNGRA